MNAPLSITDRLPRPAPLNRLERAGWAVLATGAFRISTGEAAVLRELVLSAGQFVSNEHLAACFVVYEERPPRGSPALRLASRVAKLRNALEDFGLPRSAIENLPGVGYAMAAHHAASVRSIVEGGV